MSLFASSAETCHLTMSAPSVEGVGTGAYTVAVLFMPNLFSGEQMIWRAYEPSNFSHRGLYVNGDMWIINQQAAAGISNFGNPQAWYWFVVTKSSANENPRAHWALYEETGTLAWTHVDANSSQSNQSSIDRICLGDELSTQFRGNIACLAAFEVELDDEDIELVFERNSFDILDSDAKFFVHWPESEGIASAFQDIAGGGIETIRSGNWATSADPPAFDFSLERTGKPKVWDGSGWIQHPIKTFQSGSWINARMNGHNGTSWIAAK